MSATQIAISEKPSKRTRKDPTARPGNGQAQTAKGESGWFKLIDADPRMVYRWVYKVGEETNSVPYYESIGYDVVRRAAGEVRPAVFNRNIKVGDPWEARSHVLMSVSMERFQEIEQFGDDGNGGQANADFWENRIRKSGRVDNPFAEMKLGYVREEKFRESDEEALNG